MTKCDFCVKSTPQGVCTWSMQSLREDDCEKAIKLMVKALGQEPKESKKRFWI